MVIDQCFGYVRTEGAEGGKGYPREREHFYTELSGLQTLQVTRLLNWQQKKNLCPGSIGCGHGLGRTE